MSGEDEPTQRVAASNQNPAGPRGLAEAQRVFNRYTLQVIAGRGGMGVVWRAHDDDLDRTVALKFLPDVVASDAEAVRDLKKETKRCLDLTHPNIVRVYDFMQGPESAAIAMEFVEGQTLAKRKVESAHGCLEVSEMAPLVAQLCAALDYAHFKAHIIHRDLKPANLLVTHGGDLKVMDFGIARSLSETRTRLTGNDTGSTSGTLLYMSPQQLMGDKPCIADDIYALGATLFELLAGKPPFYRGDGFGLMTQIREKTPPTIARQREDLQIRAAEPVPAQWEEAIAACLAKDAESRPKSAGELAARLGLAVTPVTGSSASRQAALPPPPPPKSDSRGVNPLVIGGIVVVAAVIAAAVYSQRDRQPAGGTPPPVTAKTSPLPTAPKVTTTPATAVLGGVIVRTDPAGAEVTVGALDHGPGPLTLKDVRPGTYPVRVRAPGYEDWTGETVVKENDFADLSATLVRSSGYLLVTSEPAGLEVEVTGRSVADGPPPDGRQVLKTPQRVRLSTGSYALVFRRDGWPDQTQTVDVGRGQNVEAEAAFAAGKLVVTSEPSGAEVVQGGKVLGVTPLVLADLQPGTQTVEVRLRGFKPATISGDVTARGERRIYAALERYRGFTPGTVVTVEDLAMEFRPIAAGSFRMGSPQSEPKREKNEGPQTDVTFSEPFWMGRTEVTQHQYEAVMGVNPSRFKAAGPSAPVENVSWNDAVDFCRKLTDRERQAGRLPEGFVYSLPTEAEWEYACRAGTATPYAGDVNALAWHEDDRDQRGKTTHPVGEKRPNAWGLYDMHGNVAEWCADNYADNLPGGSVRDYAGPATGSRKVYRGGSWDHSPEECRSAVRVRESATERESYVGFRVVLRKAPGA